MIFSLFEEEKGIFELTDNEKDFIKLMNEMRNYIFHKGYNVEFFASKYNIKMSDFSIKVDQFIVLIERIMFSVLKLIPDIFRFGTAFSGRNLNLEWALKELHVNFATKVPREVSKELEKRGCTIYTRIK